jgi:hypothetical protein
MIEDKLNYLIKIFAEKYKDLKLKNLFVKEQKKKDILKFGFICPGASKTIKYISKSIKTEGHKKIFDKVKRYTDALFFIEIIALYTEYVNKDIVKYIDNFTNKKYCLLAKSLTKLISKQFEKFPKYISKNLPDDFYHLRHKTLICSNDKKMVKDRIKMLQTIYNKKYKSIENFNHNVCDGKRDGVAGCRTCCKDKFGTGKDYDLCVSSCMNY